MWCIACLPKITTIQSQGHVHVHVHVGTTYIILPLLNIGSKINLQCVFEYVSYDTACKYNYTVAEGNNKKYSFSM